MIINFYWTDITTKKRGDSYTSSIRMRTSFDTDGTLYTRFFVVSNKAKRSDLWPFDKLVDAIEMFNKIR